MMRYEHEDDDEDEEEDEGDDDEDEHDDDDEDEDDDDDDEDDGDDEEDEDEDADVLVLMQTEAPSKLSSALLPVCEVPSGQPPLRSDRRPTSCHPDQIKVLFASTTQQEHEDQQQKRPKIMLKRQLASNFSSQGIGLNKCLVGLVGRQRNRTPEMSKNEKPLRSMVMY